jgi:hypothetical protein
MGISVKSFFLRQKLALISILTPELQAVVFGWLLFSRNLCNN